MRYRYGYAYILGIALQFGSSTYVSEPMDTRLVYEVNSYEGSSSKWYLLRGAKHPGTAMVDQP